MEDVLKLTRGQPAGKLKDPRRAPKCTDHISIKKQSYALLNNLLELQQRSRYGIALGSNWLNGGIYTGNVSSVNKRICVRSNQVSGALMGCWSGYERGRT
jgi:hypothetical protein